jgi:hypothetical protein
MKKRKLFRKSCVAGSYLDWFSFTNSTLIQMDKEDIWSFGESLS